MEVLIFIFIIVAALILKEFIKNLNTNIEVKYKVRIFDITSLTVLVFSVIFFGIAYSNRNEWSIDNSIVMGMISIFMLGYILYKNIRNTNFKSGIWITIYQTVLGLFIMAVIIAILNILFPREKR